MSSSGREASTNHWMYVAARRAAMASKECERYPTKKKFLDRDDAQSAARHCGLKSYHCVVCGYYHLTKFTKAQHRSVVRRKATP